MQKRCFPCSYFPSLGETIQGNASMVTIPWPGMVEEQLGPTTKAFTQVAHSLDVLLG
jgi:hypothetical protein